MKMILLLHARRRLGLDAEARQLIGVNRKDIVVIRGNSGTSVREKVYKVPSAAANIRKHFSPNTPVVFVPKTMLETLRVRSGESVEVMSEMTARQTPPPLPGRAVTTSTPAPATRPRATGGTIGTIRAVLSGLRVGTKITSQEIRDKVLEAHRVQLGDISSTMSSLVNSGEVEKVDRGTFKVKRVLMVATSEV